jgi:hypothetical protein
MYQTKPEIARSVRILSTDDPEITQIPVKNKAAIARIPVFTLSPDENENLTAKTKRAAISRIWKTIPEFGGIPSVLTKKRSNFEEMVTTPGIIPYISNARSTIEVTSDIANPFHENSNFLK